MMTKIIKDKRKIRKRNLIRKGILLTILTVAIIFLLLLFNSIVKTSDIQSGLSNIGLWKPLEEIAQKTNLSNESVLEKNPQTESPSKTPVKDTLKQYWISYVALVLIVILLVIWVLIIFRIYNG